MTLRDHFHPPLSERRHWHSFHNGWAYNITADLNLKLPKGYFAEANVQFGIEIDVATFEENDDLVGVGNTGAFSWQPPTPTKTIPLSIITDTVEIGVYENVAGPNLVAAIEIVSPANKDRAAHRKAFVSKCETFLHQGIGLIIVDVVTSRKANLHAQLVNSLGSEEPNWETDLYTAAYHPTQNNGEMALDIWQHALDLGKQLPDMPLWLKGGLCLQVDLYRTYSRTIQAHRIEG